MKSFLRWLRRAFFAAAFCILAYCAVAVADSWTFQKRQRRQFESLLAGRALPVPVPDAASGVVGLLDIPRLGVSVMVTEGVGTGNLRRAAGHIPGTALPGQPGNAAISAHRDTFFRPLRNIRQNDLVIIRTVRAEYRYRVVSTRIVSPSDVAVLDSAADEVLTLVTCYPFYFVGSAPGRFIVRAVRISSTTTLSGIADAGRLR